MANDLHYNSISSSALSLSSVIARNYRHLIHEKHSNAKMELNFMLQFKIVPQTSFTMEFVSLSV